MGTGQQQRCECVVLRHVNYSEADRIVTLFCAEWGIKKGFARAARNSRKRFGASLEPFTQAVFHWRQGKGEMWSLVEADLISMRSGLRANLDCLALASYGVELVELLGGDCENPRRIYELLCSYLDFLDAGGNHAVARLLFELRLIYLLGYIPHLLHCSECLRIFNNEHIRFDSRRGGSLCLDCAGGRGFDVGLGSVGTLARSLQIPHQHFAGFKLGAATIKDSRLILTQVLQQILPREPKSLKFLTRLSVRES